MWRMNYFVLFLVILCWCQSSAFSAQASQDSTPVCSNCTEYLLVSSYVNVRDFTSNLLLNNKGPNPLPISLTFSTLKGEQIPAPPIVLPGNFPKLISLNELVATKGLPFEEGSLRIRYQYDGCLLVLSAGLIQKVPARGIVFDELLARPATYQSSQLEAVFSLHSHPNGFDLAITNTSPLKVKADIHYHSIAERDFSFRRELLRPYETKVIHLDKLFFPYFSGKLGAAGGISIEHDGKPGDLVARGFLSNDFTGYSASVDFVDPAMAQSPTLHGGGFRLGPVGKSFLDPLLVLRNVGSVHSNVSIKVPYVHNDGSAGIFALPDFTLEPGEIRMFKEELSQTFTALNLPADCQTLGLEISYSTGPGTVVAFAQSVSLDSEQVFQLPLVDPATKGAAGDYPWFITETSSPVVFLKNTSDKPQDYTVQINYEGGEFVNGLKTIPAHQTIALDICQIRDKQVKDERGKTIPSKRSSGKLSWSVIGSDAHSMIGRIEQYDLVNGVSYSFSCSNCCPNSYYDSYMNPNPIMLLMGGTVLVVPSEQDRNCYGGLLVPYTVSPSYWNSSAINVVTVQSGTVTGVSPGNATITAQWMVHNYSLYHGYCVDHQVIINRGVPAQVTPTCSISGPADVWWFNGTTPINYSTSITLTAAPAGLSTYQWKIMSGSTKAKFSNNSNIINTSTNSVSLVSTAPSVIPNDVQVQMCGRLCSTCSYGPQSPSFSISVRKPHKIVYRSDQETYPDTYWGYLTRFIYNIFDQLTAQLPYSVESHENWDTLISPPSDYKDSQGNDCNWTRAPRGSYYGMEVTDDVYGERVGVITLIPLVCSTYPNCGTRPVQHWNGEWRVGSTTFGAGVRVQTNTWQKYENKADHTNKQSPAP